MKKALRFLGISACIFFVLILASIAFAILREVSGFSKRTSSNRVGVINLEGMILSSTEFVRELEELVRDKGVKAVVVRVDSPGGLVAPSQEIYKAIQKADEKLPVVVSFGSVAASGGYYAGLGGRKIFANPGTLTASIGVIMEFVDLARLHDWAKIRRYSLKAGKFKDIGSTSRPMKPEEAELLGTLLTDIHSQFQAAVKERRKLNENELAMATDGRVATGKQALKMKLIDALGGLTDAIAEAKKLAQLPEDAKVDFPDKREGILREFLMGEARWSSLASALGLDLRPLRLNPGWNLMLLSPLSSSH